jgi:hypothetical protein
MKHHHKGQSGPRNASPACSPSVWLVLASALVVIFLGMIHSLHHHDSVSPVPGEDAARKDGTAGWSGVQQAFPAEHRSDSTTAATAEEIVASKVSQFARSRRELVRAIGRRLKKQVPPEVNKFFDAVESGRWDEIKAHWDALARRSGQYDYSTNDWAELDPFWPAVLDAYGVAEQAHEWPAQKLLDYGNAILGSLRPGMVYMGGTDNGRWIPELLNETSSDQHIVVTQNALADARYLDFINTLYGDRFSALTPEDSQAAFQAYVADAQKRLEHDQKFPDEPKQVRPGEDIRMVDGKAQVSGQTSVMAINERLLQTLRQKNPDLSFAVEESFPLRGTYQDAVPLGPLMELGVSGDEFTAERAQQSFQYWQAVAQEVLADPDATGSPAVLKSYSHDTVAAANLLAARNFPAEAEQAYRLGTQLWAGNPESVGGLADLLAQKGREAEARQLLGDFAQQYPDEQKNLERVSATWRLISPAQSPSH